jgi:hypothetical protein
MGREWGRGGQFTSNLGPGWTRIASHREEGFQESKRDLGTRGVIKGNWQGELTEGHHRLSVVIVYICIMILCECG